MEITKLPDISEANLACRENFPGIVEDQEPQRILSLAAKPSKSIPGDLQTDSKERKAVQLKINKESFLSKVSPDAD